MTRQRIVRINSASSRFRVKFRSEGLTGQTFRIVVDVEWWTYLIQVYKGARRNGCGAVDARQLITNTLRAIGLTS